MMAQDSRHWRRTEALRAGAALSSLDVRRLMSAAAARPSWRVRVARRLARWMARLRALRARVGNWGRHPEGQAPRAAAGHVSGQTGKL